MTEKVSVTVKRQRFLDAYRLSGTITSAAAEAGVTRKTVHNWRDKNKKFNAAFEEIREEQDDKAYTLILIAIDNGDIEAAKWLLTRPGRRYHDDFRRIELSGHLSVEHEKHIVILEQVGVFLAKHMTDPDHRTALLTLQKAAEK